MAKYEGDLNLGNLGEAELSIWCTSARLTSNRSLEEDKMGWDHLIEFPYEKLELPRDKQLKPIECKVQVKSTLREDKGVNIKLSALKRLVDYTSPAFILFYEYSDACEPKLINSYLVHVDEKLITRVLKRVRQNDTSKKTKKLYDIKLKVSYSNKHRLRCNSGIALRDRISSYVLDGMAEYQKAKNELTEKVGYGNNSLEFKFEAIAKELTDLFTASALGLGGELDVRNTVITDKRFNLKGAEVEIERSDVAKISVMPNKIDRCALRFKTSQYSPAIEFNAEFVKMPNPLKGKNSLYIRTTLFSIEIELIDDRDFEAKLHETLDKPVELNEAIKFLKFFAPENMNKKFIMELEFIEESRKISFVFNMQFSFPDSALITEPLKVLMQSYEIDGRTLTSLEQLFQAEDRLNALSRILQNNVDGVEVKLPKETPKEQRKKEIVTPFTMITPLGGVSIGCVSLIYSSKVSDYEYKAFKAEIIRPLVFYNEKVDVELLQKLQLEAILELESRQTE